MPSADFNSPDILFNDPRVGFNAEGYEENYAHLTATGAGTVDATVTHLGSAVLRGVGHGGNDHTLFYSDCTTMPALTQANLTWQGGDSNAFSLYANQLRITGGAGGDNGNYRECFYPSLVTSRLEGEVYSKWAAQSANTLIQQGHAHCITTTGSNRCVTVTKNVTFGIRYQFNFHTWDSVNNPASYTQFAAVTVLRMWNKTLPWYMRSRIIGNRLQFKVWAEGDTVPEWADPIYGGEAVVPSAFLVSGRHGWYIGHLGTGGTNDYDDLTVAEDYVAVLDRAWDGEADLEGTGSATATSLVACDCSAALSATGTLRATASGPPWNRIQTVRVASNSATSLVLNAASGWATPTAGNLLILIFTTTVTATAATAPDGTWTLANRSTNGTGNNIAIHTWYKTAAGTETTLTVSDQGPTVLRLVGLEYSGLDAYAFDQVGYANSGSALVTSRSVESKDVTSVGNELCLSALGLDRNVTGPFGLSLTSWTQIAGASPDRTIVAQHWESTVAIQDLTWNWATGAKAVAVITTFRGYVRPTAALSGTGTLSAFAASAHADLTGTGDATGNPLLTTIGSAAATGTGSIELIGDTPIWISHTGDAALTGTGAIDAHGELLAINATSAFTGAGALSATGVVAVPEGSSALAGTGTLTVTGVAVRTTTAALTGTGTSSVAGSLALPGGASLSGTSAGTANGTVVPVGRAALSGVGAAVATSSVMVLSGSAALTGAANTIPTWATYDPVVLADDPVGYWHIAGDVDDYAGNGLGGIRRAAQVGDYFDGENDNVEISDDPRLSVVTTGELTLEAWLAPDTTSMARQESTGYVHWMGKGTTGQHEWVCRMYQDGNSEDRANRISGYVYPLAGGAGIGSYFEDTVVVGAWIHYVLAITYDGVLATTTIFKNGVQRDTDNAVLTLGDGAASFRIGTRDLNSFFQGRIRGVAIYPSALDGTRILAHYDARLVLATGRRTAITTTALSATGAMTVSGDRYEVGSAALTGTGTLSATGSLLLSGNAALTGTSAGTVDGGSVRPGDAALTGTGSTTSDALVLVQGSVALTGTSAGSAEGVVLVGGELYAFVTGTGATTVSGDRFALGTVTTAGTGALTAVGERDALATAALSATGTLAAQGFDTIVGDAALAGTGTATGIVNTMVMVTVTMDGLGTLTVPLTSGILTDSVAFTGTGSAAASATVLNVLAVATLAGLGTVTVSGEIAVPGGTVAMVGTGTLVVGGATTWRVTVRLSGRGTLRSGSLQRAAVPVLVLQEHVLVRLLVEDHT